MEFSLDLYIYIERERESGVGQNFWISGLCPPSRILNILENTAFRKLDMFPFSGERRGETPSD
jgi:hypothetical protein